MKLAVFDFDSTLMKGETLEFLAQTDELKQEMKNATDLAMNGKLDFFESLTNRVAKLKGMDVNTVNEICTKLPYNKGAKELISKLKENNVKVVCFSGGFVNALVPAKINLGFDVFFCNVLHEKEGILTGKVGGEMMFNNSKGNMLAKLQILLDVKKEDTMVVGDGANDLSMFKYAEKRVSFCGKEILRQNANIVIDIPDLSEIEKYI